MLGQKLVTKAPLKFFKSSACERMVQKAAKREKKKIGKRDGRHVFKVFG